MDVIYVQIITSKLKEVYGETVILRRLDEFKTWARLFLFHIGLMPLRNS